MRKAILTTLAAAAIGSVSLLAASASLQAKPLSSDDLTTIMQNVKNATYTQYTVRHHRTVHRAVAMHPRHVVVHRRVALHRGFVGHRRIAVYRGGRVYAVTARRYYAWAPRRVAGFSSWRYRYPAYYAYGYGYPRYWSGAGVTTTGSIASAAPLRRTVVVQRAWPMQETWRQYYSPMNQVGYTYGYPYGLGYLNTGLEPTSTGSIFSTGSFGSVTSFPQWGGQTWISYCSRRFPTYDATSNTFWGPDGQQHLCF